MTARLCSILVALSLLVGTHVLPTAAHAEEVTTEPPAAAAPAPAEPCPKGRRGGAIGGIVVGSVFWWALPMSIPVLITQTKKLKAHNRAKLNRRCQYAPGS